VTMMWALAEMAAAHPAAGSFGLYAEMYLHPWAGFAVRLTYWFCMMEVHFRSEEHTSELQSRFDLVCRLLLEKKKIHVLVAAKHALMLTVLSSVLPVDGNGTVLATLHVSNQANGAEDISLFPDTLTPHASVVL